MRETQFIEQNKKKWAKFERNLGKNNTNADELSDLFVEITDDLSYSRTFYPNRSVRVYLNHIAQKVFASVYKNKRRSFPNFLNFWSETVPQVIYESRKAFLFSFLIFMGAVFIGVFSSYMDMEFPRVILGDEYIDKTYENIENGNPMAVYQGAEETEMFLQIAFNNLKVTVYTFLSGLFFGIGSIFILIQNGIMLGSFQYLFISEGIYMESFFTIWLHGTIEISCIIIAGAAGLTMGGGLVFPGTLSRMQSLQMSAKRGVLIILTVLPLIVMAAFIEGFLTRHVEYSYIVRGIVIFGSLAFIISYYIIYPIMKARKGFVSFLEDVKLPHTEKSNIQYNQIKTASQIFSDAFVFYRMHIKKIALFSLVLTAVYTFVLFGIGESLILIDLEDGVNDLLEFDTFFERTTENLSNLLFREDFDIAWLLNLAATIITAYFIHFYVQQNAKKEESPKGYGFWFKTMTTAIICGIAIQLCMVTEEAFFFLTMVFIVPIVLLIQAVSFNENINIISAIGRALSLLGGNWLHIMGTYLAIMGTCFIFLFMATTPFTAFYFGIVATIFPIADLDLFREIFYIILHIYMVTMLFPLVYAGFGIGFYSFREIKEAGSLFEKIPQIGQRKISYGMERES